MRARHVHALGSCHCGCWFGALLQTGPRACCRRAHSPSASRPHRTGFPNVRRQHGRAHAARAQLQLQQSVASVARSNFVCGAVRAQTEIAGSARPTTTTTPPRSPPCAVHQRRWDRPASAGTATVAAVLTVATLRVQLLPSSRLGRSAIVTASDHGPDRTHPRPSVDCRRHRRRRAPPPAHQRVHRRAGRLCPLRGPGRCSCRSWSLARRTQQAGPICAAAHRTGEQCGKLCGLLSRPGSWARRAHRRGSDRTRCPGRCSRAPNGTSDLSSPRHRSRAGPGVNRTSHSGCAAIGATRAGTAARALGAIAGHPRGGRRRRRSKRRPRSRCCGRCSGSCVFSCPVRRSGARRTSRPSPVQSSDCPRRRPATSCRAGHALPGQASSSARPSSGPPVSATGGTGLASGAAAAGPVLVLVRLVLPAAPCGRSRPSCGHGCPGCPHSSLDNQAELGLGQGPICRRGRPS